jgi:hypothetical protein
MLRVVLSFVGLFCLMTGIYIGFYQMCVIGMFWAWTSQSMIAIALYLIWSSLGILPMICGLFLCQLFLTLAMELPSKCK